MPEHDLDPTCTPGTEDRITQALTAAVSTLTPRQAPPFDAVLSRRRRRRTRRTAVTAAAAMLATGVAIALPQVRDGDPLQTAISDADDRAAQPQLHPDRAAGDEMASCVIPPPPEQMIISAGPTSEAAGRPSYLGHGDYAVIGRVTAVNPLPEPITGPLLPGRQTFQPSRPHPRFEILVSALAYVAGPGRGPDLRLTGNDSHGLQPGTTYFIPVADTGDIDSECPTGIAVVPGETEIDRLVAVATAQGVPVARISARDTGSPGTAPASEPAIDSQDGLPFRGSLVMAITLAAALALALWTRRRRTTPRQPTSGR